MSGATLIDPTENLASAGITIYNYGTLQFTNANKYIAPNQYIYNYGDANWSNSTISNQGHLYVGGNFKAKAWNDGMEMVARSTSLKISNIQMKI